MASSRAWLLSLVMAGGVVGGGTLALQAAEAPASADKVTAPVAQSRPLPSAKSLDAQIATLLREDASLRKELADARRRLAAQMSEPTAPAAAPGRHHEAAESRVPARQREDEQPVAKPTPTPPPTQGTTGASGATGGDGQEDHEPGDDGGGDD